jgi:hypothetical protein
VQKPGQPPPGNALRVTGVTRKHTASIDRMDNLGTNPTARETPLGIIPKSLPVTTASQTEVRGKPPVSEIL